LSPGADSVGNCHVSSWQCCTATGTQQHEAFSKLAQLQRPAVGYSSLQPLAAGSAWHAATLSLTQCDNVLLQHWLLCGSSTGLAHSSAAQHFDDEKVTYY
jgi:hypothetical protein